MARKLTKRQQRRIGQQQARHARRADTNTGTEQQLPSDSQLGPEQTGVVITRYGAQADVEPVNRPGQTRRCFLRANVGTVVTGDEVVWRDGDSSGVIVAANPRHSALYRPDARGNLRPVAANIDRIFIVVAPEPEPFANLIDRYLVAAENQGIDSVLVLNKCDLLKGARKQAVEQLVAPYRDLGYPLLRLCAHRDADTDTGLQQLQQALSGHTSVFVGQSGVGKSSLINALLPEANTAVGGLSEARAKGTHTTTAARLFHLQLRHQESDGSLIDSPGIREFGLWHLSPQQVAEGFIEFRKHLGKCRFRDCSHEQEPECALRLAEQHGEITPERLDSYRRIVNSLEMA